MTLTPEQLKEHDEGLGGSDAPRYAHMNFDLWREKIGDAPPREIGERGDWGSRLEPAVRDWLAEQLGREICNLPTVHHAELPWLIGHLDGITREPQLDAAEGVEIKTADRVYEQEWGEVGTDEVPIRHVLQVHHYMLCTAIRRFHLAVLLGGNHARRYVIDYDPELARMLLERAKAFWHHVTTRTPPTPTTLDHVDYLYPTSRESLIKASTTIVDAIGLLNVFRRQESTARRAAEEVEVQVKTFMGNSAVLTDAKGHRLATWRQQGRDYTDLRTLGRDHPDLVAQYRTTSNFRVFRLR